jgi:hypothetical protein
MLIGREHGHWHFALSFSRWWLLHRDPRWGVEADRLLNRGFDLY